MIWDWLIASLTCLKPRHGTWARAMRSPSPVAMSRGLSVFLLFRWHLRTEFKRYLSLRKVAEIDANSVEVM